MNLKNFLKEKFGKDIFSIKENDIIKERVKLEKSIEKVSDEIKNIQGKIQKLMLESKGQPKTLKLLNVQKIKALRLESNTKQQEGNHLIQQLQLLLLIEAMKEREKSERESELTQKILNSDMELLSRVLLDTDVQKALEEGRIEKVREKLERVFGREEVVTDSETQELLDAIEDLEKVDEETALKMAGEKAKKIAEEPSKKKEEEEE